MQTTYWGRDPENMGDQNRSSSVNAIWESTASGLDESWLGSKAILTFTLATLLFYVGINGMFKRTANRAAKQQRATEFRSFTKETDSARTTHALPYGFIPSMRHKLKLLWNLSGDLLKELTAKEFAQYGATHALYDQHGLTKVVHTIDPKNVHTILSSRSSDYGIPAARLSAIGPVGSKGVVMTEGDLWMQNRRAINRGFRGARTTQGIEDNLQTFFDSITSSPDSSAGWTAPTPLFDAFAMMSLDRSINHMFGVREDLQGLSEESSKRASQWKDAFDTMAEYVSVRSVLGRMSWMWDGPAFRNSCKLLRRLCENTIDAAIARSKQGVVQASFVGNLVHETSDVRRIADITLDVFIAGHNMTAGVLTWLFFELEKRPDVYEEVRREVIEVFGPYEGPAKIEMTWDTLQRCVKLGKCIYETMRLYPTLPNIGRSAARDTVLPTGGGPDGTEPVAVAQGTVVMCCLYLMHRRPEEWGEDTGKWEPERWQGRKPGHEYAPFGGGPRVCPGQLYGLVELFYVTARIMQRFKAIKQPAEGYVVVKTSGAGVLIPNNRATLQLLHA